MTRTDPPINVEAAQDPMTKDYNVSMCMCHTPRRIYVDNLTELGAGKSVHIYVERKTCKLESVITFFKSQERATYACKSCGARFESYLPTVKRDEYRRPRFCPNCGAEVIS